MSKEGGQKKIVEELRPGGRSGDSQKMISISITILVVIVIASFVLATISSLNDWDEAIAPFVILGVVALTIALFLTHV